MIRYSPDEISIVISEIESQGGAFLPEVCDGYFANYVVPGSERIVKAATCRCGQESMAVVTYDAQAKDLGGGFARVCVNCDYVGDWPRFKSALEEE